ncbi:MAG: 4Fe-4S dicluster domain-containing protein [Actinobacteria bacterium]|nr:4Fe-4S dicluster domain-containing protein [Actinomycetota bacterium]
MKILGFIDRKNLIPWLDDISKKYRSFLPVQDMENARIDFMDYYDYKKKSSVKDSKGEVKYRPDFSEKTRLSPKMVFFPGTEKFFDFEYVKDTKDPENIETSIAISQKEETELPKLLFGVKPCDIAGLRRLDIFYGEGPKKDTYYLDKRKDSIFISLGCNKPFPDCFCTSVDGHPFDFENADIGLVEMDNGYAIVKSGEKAKKLVEDSKKFINDGYTSEDDSFTVDEIIKESVKKIKEYWKEIGKDGMSKIMDRSMDSAVWKEITAKCLSCAACTYVCPTCFCFNIRDEQKGLKGERYRCWDYCMNSYYTLEASGHNPRADKNKRYRNKVNCKYNYNIKRSNNIFCVGCGRCIEVCPVSVDIRKVVDRVLENDKNIFKK